MSPISVKLVLVARHWEVVDPARDGIPASSRLVYSGPRDLGCVRGVVPLQPDLRVWDLLGSKVRLLSCQYRFAALDQILYRSLWMSLWLSQGAATVLSVSVRCSSSDSLSLFVDEFVVES